MFGGLSQEERTAWWWVDYKMLRQPESLLGLLWNACPNLRGLRQQQQQHRRPHFQCFPLSPSTSCISWRKEHSGPFAALLGSTMVPFFNGHLHLRCHALHPLLLIYAWNNATWLLVTLSSATATQVDESELIIKCTTEHTRTEALLQKFCLWRHYGHVWIVSASHPQAPPWHAIPIRTCYLAKNEAP